MSTEDRRLVTLSLTAKAYAALLALLADEDDCLFTGGTPLVEFVAKRNGATRGDRRLMEREFSELFRVGYLSDRGDHVQVVHPSRRERVGATTKRPRTSNDSATTAQRITHDSATKNDLTAREHVVARGVLSSDSQKAEAEGQSSERAGARETTPTLEGSTREPSPGACPPAVRCPSVEPANPPPQRESGQSLIAALSAAAGDAMRVGAPAEVQLRFVAACHESDITAAKLRTLGAYLRFHREQHADQFPWRNGRRALDLAFFDFEGGVRLVEFVGRALDWHATHHATSALTESKRAHERAALDAAIAASAGVDPQRSAQLAREARATLAAMRPVDARKAS